VAVSGWVRFTEQFTSAPKLHGKINGTDIRRGTVSRWRNTLLGIQNGKCFYDKIHEMSSPEVDHVLPWSFVLEDKTWNLVLACRECNNQKRDRLTDVGALESLCSRNEQVQKSTLHTEPQFQRDFAEWHSRSLSAYVRGLYDQAIADGFPTWE
jgi:HNH endonuclease